jgi:hypothetical protein
MSQVLRRLREALPRLANADRRLDEIKINQGRILGELQRDRRYERLSDYEFKVFSQWGEDGILQHLTTHLDIRNRTFIEFGVEDFFESNCRYLLMKDRWHGFVIDGSPANIARLRRSYFFWMYRLESLASFITKDNVAALMERSGFGLEPGILSVDVDGVDYHLVEALEQMRPSIMIVEYNGLFGHQRNVTVPYDASFQRTQAHPSNLYLGASLPAFVRLLERRGYALVGVNGMGSNAFFVRKELLNDRVREVGIDQCPAGPVFREARDEKGELTLSSAYDSRQRIAHLPLVDLDSGKMIKVADLF